jgi:hypothetical protein
VSAEQLTWSGLAKALEVTRPTLAAWRKTPGAPSAPNLESWQKWAEENRTRMGGTKELRDEKTRHEIKLLKAKLDREERRVIPRDDVNRLHLDISTRQRSMLYQFMESELPPLLDGMSAVQMRPILRERADMICDAMADLVEKFDKQ